jgi:hypothetical protein
MGQDKSKTQSHSSLIWMVEYRSIDFTPPPLNVEPAEGNNLLLEGLGTILLNFFLP